MPTGWSLHSVTNWFDTPKTKQNCETIPGEAGRRRRWGVDGATETVRPWRSNCLAVEQKFKADIHRNTILHHVCRTQQEVIQCNSSVFNLRLTHLSMRSFLGPFQPGMLFHN